jgi:hypothetical protein
MTDFITRLLTVGVLAAIVFKALPIEVKADLGRRWLDVTKKLERRIEELEKEIEEEEKQ